MHGVDVGGDDVGIGGVSGVSFHISMVRVRVVAVTVSWIAVGIVGVSGVGFRIGLVGVLVAVGDRNGARGAGAIILKVILIANLEREIYFDVWIHVAR